MPAVDPQNPDAVASVLHDAAAALRAHPCRRGCVVHLPAKGKLVVTGDLHDRTDHLAKVLHAARLDKGEDRHVILQELIHGERFINGMDFSHRMILKVATLVLEYPLQVHPLLANHEISQLTGRGVSKGAGNSTEMFNDALDYVFGAEADVVSEALNDFFRTMPLALISNDGVFCAHSLPNARLAPRIEGLLERELDDDDFAGPLGGAYLMTWGRAYDNEQIHALAEKWNVRLICVGHAHVEDGIEAFGDMMVRINSDHDRGRILPVDLANVPDVENALLQAVPVQSIALPDGASF